MVELEGMDLSGSETCPLSLAREITPRSDKLRSQGRGELLVSLCHQVIGWVGRLKSNRLTILNIDIILKVHPSGRKNSSHIIELKLILKAKFSIQPAASRITVVVLKARNLPKMDITGLSGLESYSLYIVRNHLTSSLDIKGLIGKG